MIRIRLARVGKKKQPTYRLVVATKEAPRDGRFIEILGHYDPLKNPSVFEFNADRTREWIAKGAQPSEAAAKLLAREGIGEAPKRPTKPTREERKAAEAESAPVTEAAAPAATPADEAAEAPEETPAEANIEAEADAPAEAAALTDADA
ncbi:MAG TPA: 30S ribosomal protein S16, partial [Dehalococcoidia bacterium]|nr:30S ribosomal protein S16 [Dehalococcoidia bacterium]